MKSENKNIYGFMTISFLINNLINRIEKIEKIGGR